MRNFLILLSSIVLANAAQAARFPTPEPSGIVFEVDGIHTANFQPSIAFASDGSYVAVWTRWTDAGHQSEVVAQRFGPVGQSRGLRFRVNTFLPSFQAYGVVAMNAGGQFAVTWASYTQDGQVSGIYARAFTARGAAATAELPVNTSLGGQSIPTIGIDRNGGFAIAWYNEYGTYLRRFSAAGDALGPEAQVSEGSNPRIAMNPDGSFVLVWRDYDPAQGGALIRGRRFSRSGTPSGPVLAINSRPIPSEGIPAVALTPDGGFLVAWDRCDFADFSQGCEVRVRRYDARSQPVSADWTISPADRRGHEWPTVAVEPGGYSAVAWDDCALDGGGQTYDCKLETLFFDPAGHPAPALASLTANADLMEPSIAAGGGAFLLAYDTTNCDVSQCYDSVTGTYGRRYRIPRPR